MGFVRHMKVILIFLDIDGVLNTSDSLHTKYEICNGNVEALEKLCKELTRRSYTVKVILTSTWRLGYDSQYEKCSPQVQRLLSKFMEVGIQIFGKTPVYKEKPRDVEIMRVIREYQLKNNEFTYFILDDDISVFDREKLQGMNFYKVNQHTGLMLHDVGKILRKFGF